jgi:hypothetical protein
MEQDAPGDALYMSVSGRLRAYRRDENGAQRLVRELSRGQVFGEMSLLTGEPRSATIVAIRDSVLVRCCCRRHPDPGRRESCVTRRLVVIDVPCQTLDAIAVGQSVVGKVV